MGKEGCPPNRVTYLAVLQAYSRAGRPKEVERLLSEMLAKRLKPDERCVTALLLAHSHAPPGERRSPDEIALQVQRLVSRGLPVSAAGAAASSLPRELSGAL